MGGAADAKRPLRKSQENLSSFNAVPRGVTHASPCMSCHHVLSLGFLQGLGLYLVDFDTLSCMESCQTGMWAAWQNSQIKPNKMCYPRPA